MRALLAFLLVLVATAWASAQQFDDPAVTVCELLMQPEYEIEKNVYRRLSASVAGQGAAIDAEWGVPGARPHSVHYECKYRMSDGEWALDVPLASEAELTGRPGYRAILASGLYPIPETETALR